MDCSIPSGQHSDEIVGVEGFRLLPLADCVHCFTRVQCLDVGYLEERKRETRVCCSGLSFAVSNQQ